MFIATDWQALLRGAALVEAFDEKPSAQLAAEIRQIEARLGGALADRDRLGMKIEEPKDEAAERADGRVSNRKRPDPRKSAS